MYIDSDGNKYESYKDYVDSHDLDPETVYIKLLSEDKEFKLMNDIYVFVLNKGITFEELKTRVDQRIEELNNC